MNKLTIYDKFNLTLGLLKGKDVEWTTKDAIEFLEDRASKCKPKSKVTWTSDWPFVKTEQLEYYNLVYDYLGEVDYAVNAECVSENCGIERWRASNILNYFSDHGYVKNVVKENEYTEYFRG